MFGHELVALRTAGRDHSQRDVYQVSHLDALRGRMVP